MKGNLHVVKYLYSQWTWDIDYRFNLNITFTYFHLQYSGEACTQERVIVIPLSSRVIGRYCGQRHIWSILLSPLSTTLEFHSFTFSTSTFNLTYQVTDDIVNTYMFHYFTKSFSQVEIDSFVAPFSWMHGYHVFHLRYYSWNIFVPKMFKLVLRIQNSSLVRNSIYIYDGPDYQSNKCEMTQNTTCFAKYFQAFILLKKYCNYGINFESILYKHSLPNFQSYFINEKSLVSHQYVGHEFHPDFLKAFKFHTFKGTYLNITLLSLKYKGSNTGYCKYGGLSIYDVINGTLKEDFLLCDTLQESAIIPKRHIVSNTESLFLIYYSYWPYSQIELNLTIQPSSCKGLHLSM